VLTAARIPGLPWDGEAATALLQKAWDSSAPIVEQAEGRYYPLYVHTCHLRYRLEVFAEAAIDYRLDDTARARRLLDEFHAFRNQYWFKSPTVDVTGGAVFDGMRAALLLDP